MNKNNVRTSRLVQLLAACALAGSATSSFALTSWNLSSGCASSLGVTTQVTCSTVDGNTIKAQAFSTQTSAGTSFTAATLNNYGGTSGLAVNNQSDTGTSPTHAMDNALGTDLIALNFGTAVNLSSITLGWWAYDTDITVLAYTGAGAPTISGKNINSFTAANGWTSVKNYGSASAAQNTGGTDTDKVVNLTSDTTTYSSWWLISAYNSSFTGTSALDSINDYVKLLSVAGSTKITPPGGKVPEPGSLALIGVAFCAFLTARRRKTLKV